MGSGCQPTKEEAWMAFIRCGVCCKRMRGQSLRCNGRKFTRRPLTQGVRCMPANAGMVTSNPASLRSKGTAAANHSQTSMSKITIGMWFDNWW